MCFGQKNVLLLLNAGWMPLSGLRVWAWCQGDSCWNILGLVVVSGFLVEHVGHEKQFYDGENHHQFDDDHHPQCLADVHIRKTLSVEIENPFQRSCSLHVWYGFNRLFIVNTHCKYKKSFLILFKKSVKLQKLMLIKRIINLFIGLFEQKHLFLHAIKEQINHLEI